MHAIASDEGICIVGQCTPCVGVNGAGAAVGTEHFEAASVSGGLQFSICTEDWSALFSELATVVSVALPLPCVFSVPSAEAGETVNPDKVNVVFTEVDSDDGAALPRVTSEDACAAQGWYYDDPSSPAEIRLCAESCSAVEASLGGRVDIALGCDTILY